jgi:hypothetical protein
MSAGEIDKFRGINYERQRERENACLALLDELRYTNRLLAALLTCITVYNLPFGASTAREFVVEVGKEAFLIELERSKHR